MLMRLFIAIIIIIAVAVGIAALVLPRDQLIMVRLIIFRDFFDVTLPILAFGALIKYLCTCHAKCNCKCCTEPKV